MDQESLILTALILGVGYMLVTNTPGVAVDPREGEREGADAVQSLKTRAQGMLQRASQFHSQVGDMDLVEEPKRELMDNFLRYQREASQIAVRYPERRTEIDFMVNEIEKAKVDLVPDTYKRAGESIEPPAKRTWSPELREVSRARSLGRFPGQSFGPARRGGSEGAGVHRPFVQMMSPWRRTSLGRCPKSVKCFQVNSPCPTYPQKIGIT